MKPRDDNSRASALATSAWITPLSRNRGVTDVDALKAGTAQPAFADSAAGFALFRIGDAVASRDVHAAMLDALRVLKDC